MLSQAEDASIMCFDGFVEACFPVNWSFLRFSSESQSKGNRKRKPRGKNRNYRNDERIERTREVTEK